MNSKVLISVLAVLCMSGTHAFAQFKVPVKAALNAQHLERLVARSMQGAQAGETMVRIPGVVSGRSHVVLTSAQFPLVLNPVTKSYENYISAHNHKTIASIHRAQKQMPSQPRLMFPLMAKSWTLVAGGKAFYDNQSQLAHDLDKFYKGNADTFIAPDGRNVKLYALPVDGILYQPVGYKTPVVLNSNEYFVIYDIQAGTGKIAENKPEVYNLFKPRLEDEIWQAMGSDKVFDDLNSLCDSILMAHLHKNRLEQLRAAGIKTDTYKLVKEAQSLIFKQLNTSEELLPYLTKLPKVRQLSSGFKAYVVELPVEGLAWIENNHITHFYNSKDHVLLFFELGAVGIYPRAEIENPELFKSL